MTPHTGSFSAWLGGAADNQDFLFQDVNVPIGVTSLDLHVYLWIATEEPSGAYDTAMITLRDPTTETIIETLGVWTNSDETSNWLARSLSVAGSYAGQSIRVSLESSTDETYNTNFFFDSLSLNAVIGTTCEYVLAGDMNDDCKVDFRDLAVLAKNWLIDCDVTPEDPNCVPK